MAEQQMTIYDAMKKRAEDDARKRIEDISVQQKAQRTGMRDIFGMTPTYIDPERAQAAARARAKTASMPTRADLTPSRVAQNASMFDADARRASMSDASKRGMKGAKKLLRTVGGPAGYALGALGVKEVYDRVKSGELDPNSLVEMLDPLFLGPSQTLVSGDQERAEIASAVREAERQAAIDELAGPDFLTTDEDVELLNRAQIRKMDSEIPIRLPPTDTDVLEPNRVRLRRMN